MFLKILLMRFFVWFDAVVFLFSFLCLFVKTHYCAKAFMVWAQSHKLFLGRE